MRLRAILGVTAVLAIALGSVLGALAVRANERDAFDRRERELALRAANEAEAQATLALAQLANAVAFRQTDDEVSEREFEVFSRSQLRSDTLDAAALAEPIEAGERRDFERRRGVRITERDAAGRLRPAARRRVHFALTHSVGEGAARLAPPGFDIGSDPRRRSVLLSARDSGRPTSTGVVSLLIGGDGISLWHPIYADGAPTATPAQRRRALIGFAGGALRISDLIEAAKKTIARRVGVQLVEGSSPVGGNAVPRQEASAAPVAIADRKLLLLLYDPAGPGLTLPLLMAVLGLSLAALLGSLVLIWSRNERMQELQRQAAQDPLTGLKNRRRFEEDLSLELARSRRERTPGAMLMIDLDNFKEVNDTRGHPVGDRVLVEIADVLRQRVRETDVLARLGGDEFAVVLPRCGPEEAVSVAEEIAAAIRGHEPEQEGVPPLTASIGVATFGPASEDDLKSVEIRADAAMYEAKQSGRDAIRVAGDSATGAATSGRASA